MLKRIHCEGLVVASERRIMNGARSGVNPSRPRLELREKLRCDIRFWEEGGEFRNVVSSGTWVIQIRPGRSGDLATDAECVPHELGLPRDEGAGHGGGPRWQLSDGQ